MNLERAVYLRMQRQGLIDPVEAEAYDALFRFMSPVHTLYWSEPGAPPVLQRRARFDDWAYNNQRRAERRILKGRYQNGSVGYVDRRDLTLYACAFKKEIPALNFQELMVLDILNRESPVTIGGIKEMTGMLVKNITPILHRLQQAFLVFEDQSSGENDRGWYAFDSAFPEVDLHQYTRMDAIAEIIKRFLYLAVYAEADGIKSFYGFTTKDIKQALVKLCEEKTITPIEVDGRTHYCLSEDEALLASDMRIPINEEVFLLHRSDFWVKSEEYLLKKRFQYVKPRTETKGAAPEDEAFPPVLATAEPQKISRGADVLYYIVINGCFKGAVMGRFKFGPHLIEDVVVEDAVEMTESVSDDAFENELKNTARMYEILEAVYEVFDREASPVRHYNGLSLP